MRGRRLIWFFLMIILGLASGLVYGWLINPIQREEISLDTLRADYRADFVLMTAEIYQADGDREGAAARLSQLGTQPPEQIVREAIQTGRNLGYAEADMERMDRLALAVGSLQPDPTATGGAQ